MHWTRIWGKTSNTVIFLFTITGSEMMDISDLQWLVCTNKILVCYEYANLKWQRAPCVASGQNIDEVPIWSVSVPSLVSFRTVLSQLCQDNVARRPRSIHELGKEGPRRIQFLTVRSLCCKTVLLMCMTLDTHCSLSGSEFSHQENCPQSIARSSKAGSTMPAFCELDK